MTDRLPEPELEPDPAHHDQDAATHPGEPADPPPEGEAGQEARGALPGQIPDPEGE